MAGRAIRIALPQTPRSLLSIGSASPLLVGAAPPTGSGPAPPPPGPTGPARVFAVATPGLMGSQPFGGGQSV